MEIEENLFLFSGPLLSMSLEELELISERAISAIVSSSDLEVDYLLILAFNGKEILFSSPVGVAAISECNSLVLIRKF